MESGVCFAGVFFGINHGGSEMRTDNFFALIAPGQPGGFIRAK